MTRHSVSYAANIKMGKAQDDGVMAKAKHTRRKKNGIVKRVASFFARCFCKRSIIIVSEHKRGHVAMDGRLQFVLFFGTIGLVAWMSYSTGNYVAVREKLEVKEKKLESVTLETQRVESEFSLLKRDLNALIEQDGEVSEYTKFVIDQYQNESELTEEIALEGDTLGVDGEEKSDAGETKIALNSDIIFERIEFLEKTVQQLQSDKESVIAMVEETTNGKIKELEKAIRTTGLPKHTLEKLAEKKMKRSYKANGKGGPYIPADLEDMSKREKGLYGDLRRLMLLNKVVEALPIARPMKVGRTTSGFGYRRDPFSKRPALHGGLDFAGPNGARIYSSAPGKVIFSGVKSGYGNVVDLQHDFGLVTRYAHMRKRSVEVGRYVGTGTVIGIQGSTGRSTGDHLHYEVRYHGKPLNPRNFINAGSYVR